MSSGIKKSIGKIALGLIFLFNPAITVVDLVPDFIGCLLIISGLGSLLDLSDSMEEARVNFLRLFWISLSHIPAFAMMIFISSNFISEKTSILVFSFVYAVVEFVLVNNALTALIDGFVYVGERYDGDSCFYEIGREGKHIDVSHLRAFSTIFLVLTKGLSVLPNLVYLYDTSLGYGTVTSPYMRNPVEFIGILTVICIIPATIVGVMWAIRAFKYVKGISHDDAFVARLDVAASDKSVQNTAAYKFRRTTTAALITYAACVLSVDFYVEEFNIIPDIVCAITLLCAVVYIRRRLCEISYTPIVACSIYALACVCMLALAIYFDINNIEFWRAGREPKLDNMFRIYTILSAVCDSLFVVAVAAVMYSYTKALKGGFDSAVRRGHTKSGVDIFYRSHKIRSVICVLLSLVAGVCHTIQISSMGNMKRVLLDKNSYTDSTGVYVPALEGFWMVALLANVVFIVFAIYTISKSREELRERLYII